MDECLVSVIVPVYYVDQKVFRKCMESILGQTERKIEVIVIFDGTKSLYEELLRLPVFCDTRIKIIDKEHGGVSAARNKGLKEAQGEWILFADADDRLRDDAVRCLLKAASAQTDLVIGDYMIRYPQKTVGHAYKKEAFQVSVKEKVQFLEDILNPQSGMGFCWAKLYRRKFICTNRLRFQEDLEVAEDAQFVLQYAMRARGIRYIPGYVYIYQINPDSAVRRFREDYAERYEKSMRSIFYTIQRAGFAIRLRDAYETCVLYHFLLITVNYSFHPKQKKSRKQQIQEYKKLTEMPLYAEAIQRGNAGRFSITRRVTVRMIRLHFWNGVYLTARIRHKQLKSEMQENENV